MMWTGEYPCDEQGRPISRIEHGNLSDPGQQIGPSLFARFSFSSKPVENGQKVDYPDYYAKMTTYAAILGAPAQALQPGVTAQTAPFIPAEKEGAIFKFIDTATSRAALDAATAKLAVERIAIIGLGGTGSYVLDLIAKVPARFIHLYDGDRYLQHNAFRSPGAISGPELAEKPYKVDHWCGL